MVETGPEILQGSMGDGGEMKDITKLQREYYEKLKDPRWQRLRLEVFNRDEWTCRKCQSQKDTLVVHHLVYKMGAEPWEYMAAELITLCSQCHEYEHEQRKAAEHRLLEVLRLNRYFVDDINGITDGLLYLKSMDDNACFVPVGDKLRWALSDKDMLQVIEDEWIKSVLGKPRGDFLNQQGAE